MFSNYQVLLILVVSACIGYLVVYGSSSTSIKEGLSKKNKCKCPHGTAATGDACGENNALKCIDCDDGFNLNSVRKCIKNICTCPHGTPVAGTDCVTNNSVKCAKCSTGFNLVNGICQANQKCSSYTCPTGRQYKSNYKNIHCKTPTCEDSECCDPIPQPSCTSFPCPQNSTLNKFPGSILCAGQSCTDADCCTANKKPTCFGDNMKCPPNFYLKSNGQEIQCANYNCTTDECCSANPTCSSIECDPKYNAKPASTICKGSTCTQTECCVTKPNCLAYVCPDGMKRNANATSIACTGDKCLPQECCSLIPSPPPTRPPSGPQLPDPTNIYFPNANFIAFNNGGEGEESAPLDNNEDSYPHSYSNYNGWTTPKETPLSRTNNMFSDTNLPPPVGIASFNNRSYNQA